MLPVAWLQLFHLLGEAWCVVLVMVAVSAQWAFSLGVCDLSAGGWRELKKEAGDVPAGGGTEEGLLGEKFLGMFTNVFFFCFSADLCASEGVRNILCKVSLPLSSLSLLSLVC